jgi:hypothetical protein
VRRVLAWVIALPLTAAGILCAHALAYAATGAAAGNAHAYLAHAPQLVAVLATAALAALVFESRASARPAWPFAAFALAGFAAQEHVERLLHTGELPWLLTSPTFLLGLALQVPFAAAAWLSARLLLRVRARPLRRPPRIPSLVLPLPSALSSPSPVPVRVRRAGRAPPALL